MCERWRERKGGRRDEEGVRGERERERERERVIEECSLYSPLHRFIRGKVSFADQSERESAPKGLTVVNLLYGSKLCETPSTTLGSCTRTLLGRSISV